MSVAKCIEIDVMIAIGRNGFYLTLEVGKGMRFVGKTGHLKMTEICAIGVRNMDIFTHIPCHYEFLLIIIKAKVSSCVQFPLRDCTRKRYLAHIIG